MERTLYGFNSSQDIIDLQTKYTLFKRVANILFSTTVEGGFDEKLMTATLNKVIERNDCLRITFVKDGKETKQYFEQERTIGKVPSLKFCTWAEYDAFICRFRKKQANPFKGDVFSAVYAVLPTGEQTVIFKISHFVADTYGIGILVKDIFDVYKALKDGGEMPAPTGSFEAVLKKDLAYKDNAEAIEKDREFFNNYYKVLHPNRPMYCGVHGATADKWLKVKRKGGFSMPYFFVKCDTKGYKFTIPAAVVTKATDWCKENGITPAAFFYYTCAIATSLVNDREKYQVPLMLLDCRGTIAERKAAGTKVQSIGLYVTVDYEKSFQENMAVEFADQNELYKHTKLTYLEVQNLEHELWGHSMLSQATSFCYSFIPFEAPEGVRMQILSNGKGALTGYLALMLNVRTMEVDVMYDVQTQLVKPEVLADFQNTYVHVIEAVLAEPGRKLGEIL